MLQHTESTKKWRLEFCSHAAGQTSVIHTTYMVLVYLLVFGLFAFVDGNWINKGGQEHPEGK